MRGIMPRPKKVLIDSPSIDVPMIAVTTPTPVPVQAPAPSPAVLALQGSIVEMVNDRAGLRRIVAVAQAELYNAQAKVQAATGELQALEQEVQYRMGLIAQMENRQPPMNVGNIVSFSPQQPDYATGMGSLAGLSIVAGIACVRALRECGVRDIGLKWPNDILAGGKKLAGILVELGGEFLGPCFAVIGIGINMRLPADSGIDQPHVDVATLCCGNPPSRNRIIGRLISQLVASTDAFAQNGFAAFQKEYAVFDVLARTPVRLHTPSGVHEGVADGVDARGALRVRHGDDVTTYDSAEVSVRPA